MAPPKTWPHIGRSTACGGRIHGRGGIDLIEGSYTNASDYGDKLFGEAGNDMIYGLDDRDYLHGGSGDDVLYGGEGNDRLVGGEGYDWLQGENGYDTLCDVAKSNGVCDGDDLYGGGNEDILWVPYDASCSGFGDAPEFFPGAPGNEVCGDNDWPGLDPLGGCLVASFLTAEPPTCLEPF